MRIVLTGGGSGGHITPVLAVARELKQLQPDCKTIYIGQKGDSLADIPANDPNINKTYMIRAGKLRRYHGEGLKQVLDVETTGKNIRDVGFVVAGLAQSYRLLRKLRPDIVFVKGGFVGVPVGLAAAALGIPFITHDSDALPGLANRIIARWAKLHAVALPKEIYSYPANKTVTVGVPISYEYRLRSTEEIAALKTQLGLAIEQRVIFVTGGGLGAQRLNEAIVQIAADILGQPDIILIHAAGRNHETEISKRYDELLSDTARARVIVMGYTTKLYEYSAIAEIVVTRAGGTSMAEFAAQAKACIVVPNPMLTGGHQTKNAQALTDRRAIRLVEESEIQSSGPQALLVALQSLLDDPAAVQTLGRNLHALVQPDSAHRLAVLLLEQVPGQSQQHKQPLKDNKDETIQAQ